MNVSDEADRVLRQVMKEYEAEHGWLPSLVYLVEETERRLAKRPPLRDDDPVHPDE